MVRDGLVAALVGMKDASAMKRLAMPCARQSRSTTPVEGSLLITQVPHGCPKLSSTSRERKTSRRSLSRSVKSWRKRADAISQFLLDRVFDADAVGFVVVDHNPILRVGHVLNDAHEDSSGAGNLGGDSGRYPQEGADDAEPSSTCL